VFDPAVDGGLGGGGGFLINRPLSRGSYVLDVSGVNEDVMGGFQLDFSLGSQVRVQPDNHVGLNSGSKAGDDIYAGIAAQTVRVFSRKGRTVVGYTAVENDGEIADSFRVKGRSGDRFFKVSYVGSAGNVSAGVISGTYETAEMEFAEPAERISVSIQPNKKKLVKSRGKRSVFLKKRFAVGVKSTSVFDPLTSDGGVIDVQTR
jgi:hypothetical protein